MRALRQQLESLARAGVSHLPGTVALADEAPPAAIPLATSTVPVRAPQLPTQVLSTPMVPPAARTPRQAASSKTAEAPARPVVNEPAPVVRPGKAHADRRQALAVLNEQVKKCT